MRKLLILTFALSSVAAGPFAATAGADPVRDAYCSVQEKLGFDNVQDCRLN
jgi:hypothetical protein